MDAATLRGGFSVKEVFSFSAGKAVFSSSAGCGRLIISQIPWSSSPSSSVDKVSRFMSPLLMKTSSKLICPAVAIKTSTSSMKEEKRGLYRPYPLSPELKAVVGEEEMSRVEVIQKLWAYIREHNLQDSEKKRMIRCDAALHALFEVDAVDMLQMSKLISKHILAPVDPNGLPKPKRTKATGPPKRSPMFLPQRISKELQAFLGITETELVRSTATKMIWSYIKENNLQDPDNRRNIICDSKLRDLFKCDSFVGIAVTKFLVPHFPKDNENFTA